VGLGKACPQHEAAIVESSWLGDALQGGALKAWLANNPTVTTQGRVRQVHAFFRQRTTAQVLATAAPHSSPWLPQRYVQTFRQAAYGLRQWVRQG
jgi:hypothetical protein